MGLTKLNNISVEDVTSIPVALGDMVLVSSATASASASVEFTLGDYKEYKFFFVNMHPSTTSFFQFNLSTDNGSNYNVVKTTTNFISYHNESGADSALAYNGGSDLAQETGDQRLGSLKTDNDANLGGTMQLFNPSSTTFVKHFITRTQNSNIPYSEEYYVAGYANTTSAVNKIIFRQASGNIDAGKILMYGIN